MELARLLPATLAGSAWSRTHLDQLVDLEATWAGHAAGDTLLHADIRADNILLTGQGAMVVDWPWACRGAAFTDLVLFAPSVAVQGGPPACLRSGPFRPPSPPSPRHWLTQRL